MTDRLRLLQTVRLKGRAKAEELIESAGLDPTPGAELLSELTAAGHVERVRDRFKLTAAGRAALDQLLADERSTIDGEAIAAGYQQFDEHNSALKDLMTRWQLKDGEPNDHTDSAYDGAVIEDLVRLDAAFRPLLMRFVELAPRLGHYPARFDAAVEKIRAGDHSWFARPLGDSYHTVWFELHEDLIGLAGLTRAEEAAAGRAL